MDENIFERWHDRKKKRQNHTRGWRLNRKEIDLADDDKIMIIDFTFVTQHSSIQT